MIIIPLTTEFLRWGEHMRPLILTTSAPSTWKLGWKSRYTRERRETSKPEGADPFQRLGQRIVKWTFLRGTRCGEVVVIVRG